MTDPRWVRGMGMDDERWAWGWQSSTGQVYAVLRYQGSRLRRAGPGGYRRRRRSHGFDGLWLPALLLLMFTNVHGIFVLLLAILVASVVASVLGPALRGIADVHDVQDSAGGALPGRAPSGRGLIDTGRTPPPAPYRLSGGALAAVDGHDLYRKRLLDVLKERYVNGQISLDDFEERATRIARDPSARHLG